MTMSVANRLRLDEVERRVCDIASVQLGISRHRISPSDRLLDDLNCESLDTVELFMEIEEQFHVTMPESPSCPIYKAVFTRQPFRLADLAERMARTHTRSGQMAATGQTTGEKQGRRRKAICRARRSGSTLPEAQAIGRSLGVTIRHRSRK